jgi:hypothetical protein
VRLKTDIDGFCYLFNLRKISVARNQQSREPLSEILRAGLPAIVTLGSLKDLLTNEFAPIAIPSAISISPSITTPGPTKTLLPIFGAGEG